MLNLPVSLIDCNICLWQRPESWTTDNQTYVLNLKGQSNESFDLNFFHYLNQPGPLTNGLKYLRFWFRRVIQILGNKKNDSPKRLTCRNIIPWGVMFWRIFIDSSWYDTLDRLTRKGMILWGDWLARVWYFGEMDSPRYHHPGENEKFE